MSRALLLLVLAVAALLGANGLRKIVAGFHTLVLNPADDKAIDLRLRYIEVHEWMAGRPVYGVVNTGMYPPATYAMLWPFIGWCSFDAARWIWAATCLVALGWLVRVALIEGADRRWPLKLLVVVAVLANYANAVAIGNGQMSHQAVATAACAILVATRRPGRWRTDLAAAALFVVAMAKPQIAIPFWWVLLLAPRRTGPALLAVGMYVAVTLLAASFQGPQMWGAHLTTFKWAAGHGMAEGYGNLNVWLASAGLTRLILPAWITLLAGLGIWVYFHRRADLWVLMAVAALVARVWSYHRNYDDVLLLIPLITLFRLTQFGRQSRSYWPGTVLLAALVLTMAVPARSGRLVRWDPYITAIHVAVWFAILAYLLRVARDRPDVNEPGFPSHDQPPEIATRRAPSVA